MIDDGGPNSVFQKREPVYSTSVVWVDAQTKGKRKGGWEGWSTTENQTAPIGVATEGDMEP